MSITAHEYTSDTCQYVSSIEVLFFPAQRICDIYLTVPLQSLEDCTERIEACMELITFYCMTTMYDDVCATIILTVLDVLREDMSVHDTLGILESVLFKVDPDYDPQLREEEQFLSIH